jgi:hypothetical protein
VRMTLCIAGLQAKENCLSVASRAFGSWRETTRTDPVRLRLSLAELTWLCLTCVRLEITLSHMKTPQWFSLFCGGVFAFSVNAQTMIETFDYASDEILSEYWIPSGNAAISLSDSVAPRSTAQKSMRVEFNFPSTAWATETVRGPWLDQLVSIRADQYITFRLRGDPAFAAADFRNLYLYAYDEDGNFGRWGSAVPTADEWQVLNFAAGNIEQPWDSSALPDLSRIVRFAFFQYGSQAAIEPYTATIHVGDLMVRDAPLTEFPLPSAPRELIDDFEAYADDAALRAFYTYENSPAATATIASVATPAPQGTKALKLEIDFAAGQYPWGSVRSRLVAPFSLPTNAVVSVRLKGDQALAAVADEGTTFWLSFYDRSGRGINYSTPADPVISMEWTSLEARFEDFSGTSTVDIGNLVQWRILVEGWKGTAETPAMSGVFHVDDIRITIPSLEPPVLALVREAGGLSLDMSRLTAGKAYEVRTSPDLVQWSTATMVDATSSTTRWTIPTVESKAFYQLVEKTGP